MSTNWRKPAVRPIRSSNLSEVRIESKTRGFDPGFFLPSTLTCERQQIDWVARDLPPRSHRPLPIETVT
jgi:hypothetical protein